jgi:hypothetical protein
MFEVRYRMILRLFIGTNMAENYVCHNLKAGV